MKRIFYECDRCKKTIKGRRTIISLTDSHNFKEQQSELCENCYEDFHDWYTKVK